MSAAPRKRSRVEHTIVGDDSTMLSEDLALGAKRPFSPRINLYVQKDTTNNILQVELPGLTCGDVTIDLLHDKLTISGKSADQQPQAEGGYTYRELPYGKFYRVLKVPLGMNPEDFKSPDGEWPFDADISKGST